MLIMVCSAAVFARTATSVRIERASPDQPTGAVVVTVDGTEKTIAERAWNAWIIDGGKSVVYSGSDGAGGFENEGQSLWRYYVDTGRERKLMSEFFMVQKVVETCSRQGRPVLLVTMTDGGLGATHVAVVDPTRGEVWRKTMARFLGLRNGRIAVGIYQPEDFGEGAVTEPRKMLYLDLDSLLNRPASANKPVPMR